MANLLIFLLDWEWHVGFELSVSKRKGIYIHARYLPKCLHMPKQPNFSRSYKFDTLLSNAPGGTC